MFLCKCVDIHLWRSEDNLGSQISLTFYHVGPGVGSKLTHRLIYPALYLFFKHYFIVCCLKNVNNGLVFFAYRIGNTTDLEASPPSFKLTCLDLKTQESGGICLSLQLPHQLHSSAFPPLLPTNLSWFISWSFHGTLADRVMQQWAS